tara:strand:- start:763 stop:1650 length:888 start_codon:yes stop_codon:yes gene_type:complete
MSNQLHLDIWTQEVEDILEKLRVNCVNLCEYHRRRYFHFKSYGKYFRIPIIVLASINSTASVGLQPLLDQTIVSGITCIIGMIMGIMGSIELYMGIQASMDLELKQSKEFYALAIDIYKTLAVGKGDRGEPGIAYLNKKYNQYAKICEQSNLLKRELKIDMLAHIKHSLKDRTPNGSSADELDLMDQVYTTLENHKEDIEEEFGKENQEIEKYQDQRNKETDKKLEYSKSLKKIRKPLVVGSPRETSIQIGSPGVNSDISLEEPANEVLEQVIDESLQQPISEGLQDISNNIQNI